MDNLLALLTALAAARNAVKQSDLQALRDTIAALEAENTRLRACIAALETDRDTDRREMSALSGQIDSLKRENGRLRRRIEELEAENEQLRAPDVNRDRYTQQRVIDPAHDDRINGAAETLKRVAAKPPAGS